MPIAASKQSMTTAFILAAMVSILSWNVAGAATLDELRESGIRVAIANERPYGFMNHEGEASGPGPEVARDMLAQLGISEIEWVVTSFGDLIPGLEEGRFHMAAAEMAILPDRCERIIYSEPNTTYGEGLLVKAGNPHGFRYYSDFAKPGDLKVAVMAGANQREYLQKLGVRDDRIVTIADNEDALEAIDSGAVDAYAATSLTVVELGSRSDSVEAALDFIDPMIGGRDIRGWGGFAFNSEATELRDAVNEQLVPYKYTDAWENTLLRHGFSMLDVLNSFKFTTEQLCAMN